MALVAEYSSSKQEAVSSTPSTTKNKLTKNLGYQERSIRLFIANGTWHKEMTTPPKAVTVSYICHTLVKENMYGR
jgi:hypothetical protein